MSTTTLPSSTAAIVLEAPGAPASVLRYAHIAIPTDLADDAVALHILAAPINPSDLSAVQGVYPIQMAPVAVTGGTAFPEGTTVRVPGFECVAEVVAVGSAVSDITVGDWVIPNKGGFGAWRAHAVVPASEVLVIQRADEPHSLKVADAATMIVNPPTAYRMLRDFETLKEGDVVIQNAANSAVGRYVIQMARNLGVRTVNLVRDRPEFDALAADLTALGATAVIRDGDLDALKGWFAENAPQGARLAFNAVGGASAARMVEVLGKGAHHVTYGAMSRDPVPVNATALIFKDIKMVGFWMSEWKKQASREATVEMYDALVAAIRAGEVVGPEFEHVEVPLRLDDATEERQAEVVASVAKAGSSFLGKKILLVFPH
ncbi:hypothetical protein GGF32_009419 [Allomyces javanicus]|nr:hypothetical protein GGF32_009419 [Allomyces javanicus]